MYFAELRTAVLHDRRLQFLMHRIAKLIPATLVCYTSRRSNKTLVNFSLINPSVGKPLDEPREVQVRKKPCHPSHVSRSEAAMSGDWNSSQGQGHGEVVI
jgi:hypothetical protein